MDRLTGMAATLATGAFGGATAAGAFFCAGAAAFCAIAGAAFFAWTGFFAETAGFFAAGFFTTLADLCWAAMAGLCFRAAADFLAGALRLSAALDLLVFDLLDIVFPCLHAALYRSQDRNWTFPSGLTVRLPEIQRNFRLKT
jgi:hypothetical protein